MCPGRVLSFAAASGRVHRAAEVMGHWLVSFQKSLIRSCKNDQNVCFNDLFFGKTIKSKPLKLYFVFGLLTALWQCACGLEFGESTLGEWSSKGDAGTVAAGQTFGMEQFWDWFSRFWQVNSCVVVLIMILFLTWSAGTIFVRVTWWEFFPSGMCFELAFWSQVL